MSQKLTKAEEAALEELYGDIEPDEEDEFEGLPEQDGQESLDEEQNIRINEEGASVVDNEKIIDTDVVEIDIPGEGNEVIGPEDPVTPQMSGEMQWMMQQLQQLQAKVTAQETKEKNTLEANKLKGEASKNVEEYQKLKAEKDKLMSARESWDNGVPTYKAQSKASELDAKMQRLIVKNEEFRTKIENLEKPPEQEVSSAAMKFYQMHKHWYDDPMYAKTKQAAHEIEQMLHQQGYDNNQDSFYQAVEATLKQNGFELPAAPIGNFGGGQGSGYNLVLPNSGQQVGTPVRQPAPPARRGQPTMPVGGSSPKGNAKPGKDWSRLEKHFAKVFGNDTGENRKILDRQYKIGRLERKRVSK